MFTEEIGPEVAAPRPAGARTPSRSRATCAASPGAAPTSRSSRCGWPTSSARAIRTPLTDYFALPVVPTVLGFDPRLQFVHEDDAIDAADPGHTARRPVGMVNVAGDGVILLSARGRWPAGPTSRSRPALAGPLNQVCAATGLVDFSRRAAAVPLLRPRPGHRPDAYRPGLRPAASRPAPLRRLRPGRRPRNALTGGAERVRTGRVARPRRPWRAVGPPSPGSGR